jgi:hypothetical protein
LLLLLFGQALDVEQVSGLIMLHLISIFNTDEYFTSFNIFQLFQKIETLETELCEAKVRQCVRFFGS